jgi:hypothetical protein
MLLSAGTCLHSCRLPVVLGIAHASSIRFSWHLSVMQRCSGQVECRERLMNSLPNADLPVHPCSL